MPVGGVFYIESASHRLESNMGESSGNPQQRNSVYQRVRNRNNVEDMYLRKRVEEMSTKLQFEMYRIEMERLDWKIFLRDVRACDTDDMSEFAPLLSEFLEGKGGKTRRTRFRELFRNDVLNLDQNTVELDYKKIKEAPEKLRRPQMYLNEIHKLARAKTLPDIEKWKSQGNRSGLNTANGGAESKGARPISQGQAGIIVTQVTDGGAPVNTASAHFAAPGREKSSLRTIPASPNPPQDHFPTRPPPTIPEETQKGGLLSASLPNFQKSANAKEGSATQKPTTPGISFMRQMLDTKQQIRKKRPKPLKARIQTFLDDIEQFSATKKGDNLYLPPLSPISTH